MGSASENPAAGWRSERDDPADRAGFRSDSGGPAARGGASAFAPALARVDLVRRARHGRARHFDRRRARVARRAQFAVTSDSEGGGTCRRDSLRFVLSWPFLAPLAVCGLLTGWIALSAANVQAASFSLLIYGLANLIVYTDALDFVLRLYVRRRNTATATATDDNRNLSIDLSGALPAEARRVVPVHPYAIIGSIFNLEDQLDEFMEAFAPYRDKVWLISDGSTDQTVMRLHQGGWRCFDDGVNR